MRWKGRFGVVVVSDCGDKKNSKLEVETFDLPVLLHSNTHLWK